MKDQQEIQGVNSKFSLDRARLVRTGSVPEFQDQMERKKGQNVDKGMETRQEKKRRTENNREARERERERASRNAGKKEKTKKGWKTGK